MTPVPEWLTLYKPETLLERYSLFKTLYRLSQIKWSFKLGEFLVKIPFVEKTPYARKMFHIFFAGETLDEALEKGKTLWRYGIVSMIDYAMEASENVAEQTLTYDHIMDVVYECEHLSFWKKRGFVCGIPIKITGLISSRILSKKSAGVPLREDERRKWDLLVERMRRLCQAAMKSGLKIYIDAEESWVQPAIDELTLLLAGEFNKEEVIVAGTIQFFRRDAENLVKKYLDYATAKGIKIGIKAVRGAYHDQEITFARKRGIQPIVFEKKEETDRCFNSMMKFLLGHLDIVEYNCATHNIESIKLCKELMEKCGIKRSDPRVTFAQLYGMLDSVSVELAKEGYLTFKYLPFGPPRRALRYLLRRAKENSASPSLLAREIVILEEALGLRSSTG